MANDLKRDFLTAQYTYFTNKGFHIYSGRINNNVNAYNKNYLFPERNAEKFLNSVSSLNQTSYLNYMSNNISCFLNHPDSHYMEKQNQEFLASFFKAYPENQKELLKNYNRYAGVPLKEVFTELLDSTDNKKSLLMLIASFPLALLSATAVNLEELDSYLIQRGFTEAENDKFWLGFMKVRKAHLKDRYAGPAVRDFLLNKYDSNEEKLEPYFSFFPFLENEFRETAIDIFENNLAFSTTSLISYRKMMTSFCIDKFSESDYEKKLKEFSFAFGRHYALEDTEVTSENASKGIMRVSFLHNSESFNQTVFEKKVVNFFKYLQTDPAFKISRESVSSWLAQHDLSETMEKKDMPVRRAKI